MFAAKAGDLIGPVASGGRFYVFRVVTSSDKPPDQSGNELRVAVESDLRAARQGRAYERILAQRWLPKTRCEKGYVVGGGLIPLSGGADTYYSLAGCGNFVPFKSPAPG